MFTVTISWLSSGDHTLHQLSVTANSIEEAASSAVVLTRFVVWQRVSVRQLIA